MAKGRSGQGNCAVEGPNEHVRDAGRNDECTRRRFIHEASIGVAIIAVSVGMIYSVFV